MTSFRFLHLACLSIIFLHLKHVSGWTDHYQNCSEPTASSCGKGPIIKFPFYIENLQDRFCGYIGFNVSCGSQGRPLLRLDDDYFLVKEIDYRNLSLRVVNASFSSSFLANSCLPLIHPLSLGDKFSSPASQSNITLLYSCNSTAIAGSLGYTNRCSVNSTHRQTNDFAVLRGNSLSSTVCEDSVTIPAVLENGTNESVQTILEGGFWLNWRVPYNCSRCEESGGKCGFDYDNNQFACFCPDAKAHLIGCHPGNSSQVSASGKRNNRGLQIELGVGGGALLAIFVSAAIFWYYHDRRRTKDMTRISTSSFFKDTVEEGKDVPGVPLFAYGELERATGKFSEESEVGDGAFGRVYYGKLKDGREVAVKRMYERSYQRVEQFMNEIEILARIRHKHLVSLYGCTSLRSKELLLVYEYIPNGTVMDHLHGKGERLTWRVRMNIAIETASALAYLHASDIIHRDVKTNNILLDGNFAVKVADFGLSRLFPVDRTHISTAPQGTPGYVDPEYHLCYQLTEKSDVYSFGVVLIELVSSLPAVDITRNRSEINLGYFAVNRIKKRAYDELIDESLGYKTDEQVRRMTVAVANLAYRCLQQDKDARPSMFNVIDQLWSINNNETLLPPPPSPLSSSQDPFDT